MFQAIERKFQTMDLRVKDQDLQQELTQIMFKNPEYQCGICNEIFQNSEDMACLCDCGHLFCKVCLKYYVIHKLKNQFSDIDCPRQGCGSFINTKGQIFTGLPKQLQNRYEKITQNLNAIKFRSQKLCPNCTVQMSMLKNESNLFCEQCLNKYCPLCLNKAHPKFGKCQDQIIKLLKNQYKYKRCKKCLYIVERIDGCNYMSCTCGNHFCYNCGENWNNSDHQCPPPRVYRPPLVYRTIKKEIPQRKVLSMAAVNLILNPQKVQAKGRPFQTYEALKLKRSKVNTLSTRNQNKRNSSLLMINNRSILE